MSVQEFEQGSMQDGIQDNVQDGMQGQEQLPGQEELQVANNFQAGSNLQTGGDLQADSDLQSSNAPRQHVPRATVVLAATPIGNTADASERLRELLQYADIVAAEDTRRVIDLARRLGIRIQGKITAFHDHNEREKSDSLLDSAEQGSCVLVVSDAGMPTINDPGLAIVRRAIDRGIAVTCAPGPSAVLDALALSGLPTDRFCYEGFLPRKHSDRMRHLQTLQTEARTIVFYETPHRIAQAMDDLLEAFGPDRPMALARELTKDYEQVRRGTIGQIRQGVIDEPPRGELVLVIGGASAQEIADAARNSGAVVDVEQAAQLAIELSEREQVRIKDAIATVLEQHRLPDGSMLHRKAVYQAVLQLQGKE